jgi:hypothetical protein
MLSSESRCLISGMWYLLYLAFGVSDGDLVTPDHLSDLVTASNVHTNVACRCEGAWCHFERFVLTDVEQHFTS